MKRVGLMFLFACISHPHALAHTGGKKRQVYLSDPNISSGRKRISPTRIRGLSRQLNIFGDEGYDDDDEQTGNNFEARRKMNRKPKGKGGKDNRQSDNSANGLELDPFEDHENSAPGLELNPFEDHENSAPGLELNPDEDHDNSAPGLELNPSNPYWSTKDPLPTARPGPTASPQTQPSTGCQADSNGDFGSKDGDETLVEFLYQMELFPGITIQEATMQIERELINRLIPVLFPQQCGLAIRATISIIGYVGISSAPSDAVAEGCKYSYCVRF